MAFAKVENEKKYKRKNQKGKIDSQKRTMKAEPETIDNS